MPRNEAKTLGRPEIRDARIAMLRAPHIAPLNALVDQIRSDQGPDAAVPFFDPMDGGISAKCLFVLEAPGPNAVKTGFISRDNPDETAKNFLLLNHAAGITRDITAIWNIVPWYIGTDTRIRAARRTDIQAGIGYLQQVCGLMPALRTIVLVGQKAQTIEKAVAAAVPAARIFRSPHPSPLFVNNKPGNRDILLGVLNQVRGSLA